MHLFAVICVLLLQAQLAFSNVNTMRKHIDKMSKEMKLKASKAKAGEDVGPFDRRRILCPVLASMVAKGFLIPDSDGLVTYDDIYYGLSLGLLTHESFSNAQALGISDYTYEHRLDQNTRQRCIPITPHGIECYSITSARSLSAKVTSKLHGWGDAAYNAVMGSSDDGATLPNPSGASTGTGTPAIPTAPRTKEEEAQVQKKIKELHDMIKPDDVTTRFLNIYKMNGMQTVEHGESTGVRGGANNVPTSDYDLCPNGMFPCEERFKVIRFDFSTYSI